MKITFTIIAALVLVAIVALANQARPVAFSKLRFESDMGNRGGSVVVEATQEEKVGLIAVKITAFKREYVLTKAHLAQIAGAQWNGMRVIYDGGIFGESIWIRLEVATSATEADFHDEAVVRISSDGSIEVGKLPKKSA